MRVPLRPLAPIPYLALLFGLCSLTDPSPLADDAICGESIPIPLTGESCDPLRSPEVSAIIRTVSPSR